MSVYHSKLFLILNIVLSDAELSGLFHDSLLEAIMRCIYSKDEATKSIVQEKLKSCIANYLVATTNEWGEDVRGKAMARGAELQKNIVEILSTAGFA
jgi:hypothetical protein